MDTFTFTPAPIKAIPTDGLWRHNYPRLELTSYYSRKEKYEAKNPYTIFREGN